MTDIQRELLPTEGGELPLWVARGAGNGAALVIVPSAFGVGPDLEQQMLELAEDACVVVTYDPFFRYDPGVLAYSDMPGVMRRIEKLDRVQSARDFAAVVTWARAQPQVASVVGLGICFGGPFVLLAASRGELDGVVTWHGSRMERFLDRVPEVRCPVRLHFGSVDPVTPMEAIEAIRQAFANREGAQVFVHEGATHGFSQRGAGPAYQQAAEQAGMHSARELLRAPHA